MKSLISEELEMRNIPSFEKPKFPKKTLKKQLRFLRTYSTEGTVLKSKKVPSISDKERQLYRQAFGFDLL